MVVFPQLPGLKTQADAREAEINKQSFSYLTLHLLYSTLFKTHFNNFLLFFVIKYLMLFLPKHQNLVLMYTETVAIKNDNKEKFIS